MNPERYVRGVQVVAGLKLWALTEEDFYDMARNLNKIGCAIRTNKNKQSIYIISTPYDKREVNS